MKELYRENDKWAHMGKSSELVHLVYFFYNLENIQQNILQGVEENMILQGVIFLSTLSFGFSLGKGIDNDLFSLCPVH